MQRPNHKESAELWAAKITKVSHKNLKIEDWVKNKVVLQTKENGELFLLLSAKSYKELAMLLELYYDAVTEGLSQRKGAIP